MQNFCWKYFFEILYLIVPIVISNPDPSGHMKPIGQHRPPESIPIDSLDEFPTPKVFHEQYVKTGKPLLLRGILEKGIQPAYNLWTDEFLRSQFGDEVIEVELGKKENRSNGMIEMTFSKYLQLYNTSNMYMVQDASGTMAEYINIPRSLLCGGFQRHLSSVVLWFSSGGTKSVLHTDSYDNFNCLLDGEKYLVMIDKKHSKEVESRHWNFDGSYSEVDPEKVDMYKFPNLRNVPWFEVHLKKGDCLYIPYQWYHHVDSKKGRNFAVNFWFSHLLWFNDTDCEGIDQDKLVARPIKEFSFSKEASRDEFLETFDGVEVITLREFEDVLKSLADGEIPDDQLKAAFRFIDTNEDETLSHEELLTFDVYKANALFPEITFTPDDDEIKNDSETEKEKSEENDKEDETRGRLRNIEESEIQTLNKDEELKSALDKFQQTNKLHKKEEL